MPAGGVYRALQPAAHGVTLHALPEEAGQERAGTSTLHTASAERFDVEMPADHVEHTQQTRGEYFKAIVRNISGLPTTVVTSTRNMYSRLPSFRALTAQLNRKHGIGFVVIALLAGDRMAMGLNLASAQSQIRRLQHDDECRTFQGNDHGQLNAYYRDIRQVENMVSAKCDPTIDFFAMNAVQTIDDMLKDQEQFKKSNCAEVAREPWMPHHVFDYARGIHADGTNQQKARWRKYAIDNLSRTRHVDEALKKVTPDGSFVDKLLDDQLAEIDSQLAAFDAKPNPIVCKNHPDS